MGPTQVAKTMLLFPDDSAEQIGKRIGKTRNAVIGVITRERKKFGSLEKFLRQLGGELATKEAVLKAASSYGKRQRGFTVVSRTPRGPRLTTGGNVSMRSPWVVSKSKQKLPPTPPPLNPGVGQYKELLLVPEGCCTVRYGDTPDNYTFCGNKLEGKRGMCDNHGTLYLPNTKKFREYKPRFETVKTFYD